MRQRHIPSAYQSLGEDGGFTIIELIFSMAIVGILSVIAMTSFAIYKQDVEYTKAESDMRNARTAFEVGDNDSPTGFSLPLTASQTDGGALAGPLADILPGASVSPDVMLSAQYLNCAGAPPMAINQLLLSQPCNSDRYVSFTKFCNGLQLLQRNLAQGDVC